MTRCPMRSAKEIGPASTWPRPSGPPRKHWRKPAARRSKIGRLPLVHPCGVKQDFSLVGIATNIHLERRLLTAHKALAGHNNFLGHIHALPYAISNPPGKLVAAVTGLASEAGGRLEEQLPTLGPQHVPVRTGD